MLSNFGALLACEGNQRKHDNRLFFPLFFARDRVGTLPDIPYTRVSQRADETSRT